MNKKFKISIIFAIIGTSLMLLNYIINAISMIPYHRYLTIFDSVLKPYYLQFLVEIYGISGLEDFKLYYYLYIVISNILGMLIALTGFILSLVCIKDCKLSFSDFQKRKTLHIFYIVFIGLNLVFKGINNFLEIYSPSSYLSSSLLGPVFLLALIFAIIAVVTNKTSARIQNNYLTYGNDPFAKDENGESIYANEKKIEEKLHDEYVIEKQQSEENLKNAFEQLAQIEKSYKNGEIQEEEYKNKKQELFRQLNEKK